MYRINFTTLSLLIVLGTGSLMSEQLPNAGGSIKDMYEYLLQREYAAPVSYADHQIKRKAVRSPSLRLRFGRRSDPSLQVQPEDEDVMDPKEIRAPQLRLRFGRGDPLWSSFNENALLAENFEKRSPSQRLRWGRRSEPFSSEDGVMQQKSIRAPQLRLRFGRSDPSWAFLNKHRQDERQTDDAVRKTFTVPQIIRTNESTSVELIEQNDSAENEPRNVDEK